MSNFNNVSYKHNLFKIFQNVSIIKKITNDMLSILFQVFRTQCVFYTYSIFHFGLITFQLLSSHVWLQLPVGQG